MYPETTTGINQIAGPATPGLCKVWFIPKDHTGNLWTLADVMSQTGANVYPLNAAWIGIQLGKAWLSMLPLGNIEFEVEEKEERNGQGLLFSYTIGMMASHDSYTDRGAILQALDMREHIVITKDRNGVMRLFGSNARGCDFNAAYKSGKPTGGRNVYECAFTWQSSYRALYVDAAYEQTANLP